MFEGTKLTGDDSAARAIPSRRRDTCQLSIPLRRAKLPTNPRVGRPDRIQPGAPPRGADQGGLGLGEDPMAILMEAR